MIWIKYSGIKVMTRKFYLVNDQSHFFYWNIKCQIFQYLYNQQMDSHEHFNLLNNVITNRLVHESNSEQYFDDINCQISE